jgi:TRAP-type mannitol/chloroaromatic compound transport system permease small subunit
MSEREIRPGEEHPAGLQSVEHAHSTDLPTTGLSSMLGNAVRAIGSAVSWMWLVLVAVVLTSVISRYGFNQGSVAMEEAGWFLSSFIWLIGLAYAMVYDQHVRVDFLRERFSAKTRAWIELLGTLFLLLPFLVLFVFYTFPYAQRSFELGERSAAPSGLPYWWGMKAMIGVAAILLIVTSIARLLRCTAFLFGLPKPRPADKSD